MDEEVEKGRTKTIENGNELIQLSAAEKAKWVEVVKPVIDSWAAEMDGKGFSSHHPLFMLFRDDEVRRLLTCHLICLAVVVLSSFNYLTINVSTDHHLIRVSGDVYLRGKRVLIRGAGS